MLRLLNKECAEEDNYFAIDLVNRLGDELAAKGRIPALVEYHARHPQRAAGVHLQDVRA